MQISERVSTQRVIIPSNEQRTIDAQARLIARLYDHNKALHLRATRAEQNITRASHFYLMLQGVIAENPILQSEWSRFLSFVKLADAQDQLKQPVPIITLDVAGEIELTEDELELFQQINDIGQ